MPLLAPVTSAFFPSSVISTMMRPPRLRSRLVRDRRAWGGFPHAIDRRHGASRGVLHEERHSECDEADQGAHIERFVQAEDKNMPHRIENDGKLIPRRGWDD